MNNLLALIFLAIMGLISIFFLWKVGGSKTETETDFQDDPQVVKSVSNYSTSRTFISACFGGFIGFFGGCFIGTRMDLPPMEAGLEFLSIGVLMGFVGIFVGVLAQGVYLRGISGKRE